jgi:integrase
MGVRVREKIEGSGVFWVFIHYKGKRVSRKVGGERAANDAANKIQARLTLGKGAFPSKAKLPTPRLKDYWKAFEENYKGTLKPSTWTSYESSMRIHILPELGGYRLEEITKPMMKRLVAKLVKKGLARDSIRLIVASLGILYTQAVDDKIVAENPAKGMSKFYRQAKNKHEEINPLTEDESLRFLEKTLEYENRYYTLFLCALHTGMRSGELAGLQWTDIDWNGKFLEVRRQVVLGEVTSLKTKNGRRRVDLSDDLLETLSNLRCLMQFSKWVFSDSGIFKNLKNVKMRNFKRVLKKAGIRDIRFHDLRHTFASQLLSNGTNILYVSQQLGHANPGITMKIYAKWIPKEGQREAMNNLPSLSRRRDISEEVAEGRVAV